MYQRFSFLSRPSIGFQRVIETRHIPMCMRVHCVTDDFGDFEKANAAIEERVDGDFVGCIHGGGHSASDPKRLVREVKTGEAIMVGHAERQLANCSQVQ